MAGFVVFLSNFPLEAYSVFCSGTHQFQSKNSTYVLFLLRAVGPVSRFSLLVKEKTSLRLLPLPQAK
jgi:hypothetical protein